MTEESRISARPASLVTDQPAPHSGNLVTPKLTKLTDRQHQIIQLCEIPRTQACVVTEAGLGFLSSGKSENEDTHGEG